MGQRFSDCQFAFIEAKSARDVLNISKDMMLWLLSLFQVMPNFLEFVFPFGEQLYDYDFQFSALRQDIRLRPGLRRSAYPDLDRSGEDFQLCFNLKSIESKPEDGWGWSARQAAIFHSFDMKSGQASWIVIKAQDNLRERLTEALTTVLRDNGNMYDSLASKFANTLGCHLVIVDWCAENWRWYIQHFEEQLEEKTSKALVHRPAGASGKGDSPSSPPLGPHQPLVFRGRTWTGRMFRSNTYRGRSQPQQLPLHNIAPLSTAATVAAEEPDQLPPEFDSSNGTVAINDNRSKIQIGELQNAQYLESKASEAALIVKSNIGILSALNRLYGEVASSAVLSQPLQDQINEEVLAFSSHIRQVISDLESHLARLETITKLATDRKTLLYSLVDHQNMQANEAFARKAEASATRMEDMTQDMQKLTRKTAVETVLMRIITLVTVLFLPGTFVSTMMSANIIDFTPKITSIAGGTVSFGALKFFLCLSLSLMMATFGMGYGFYLWEVSHEESYTSRSMT
jgi:hypothetical protein